MPLNQIYEELPSWACEAGCEWTCQVVSFEVSPEFLKLRYRCSSCRATATRYYDLQRRQFVAANGIRVDRSLNYDRFNPRCLRYLDCPLSEVRSKFWQHRYELREHAVELGALIASRCTGMTACQLARCIGKHLATNKEREDNRFQVRRGQGTLCEFLRGDALNEFQAAYERSDSNDRT